MFMSPDASSNNTTPKTTAAANATLFNITPSIAPASATPAATTTFSLGSTPLGTSAQLKPPTTSQGSLKSSTPVGLGATGSGLMTAGNVAATTSQSTLTFGNAKSAAAPVSFNALKTSLPQTMPNTTAITTASSLALPSSTTTSLTTSLSNKPVTSTGSSAPQQQTLTFQQLEELILNKWTAELYEQEKVFLNQATQINIWDKVINENAEKLTLLHSTMEKVRKQQGKINDDLEIISTHQKDLEACLIPMEKEDLLSVLKTDPNRKNLYINAKKIDSQIKTMSEDLKETIEHINETSRSHDTEDPVIQVGRILNAHMESLRWIDEHTGRMQDYFDSLLKMHDDLRRECELSKHDVY